MLCLFDTSAIVKLLIEEDGSPIAATLWDEASAVAVSRLAYPECRAALAAARRARRLTQPARAAAVSSLDEMWAEVRVVELTPQITALAGALADQAVLGGADAVHLASAVLLGGEETVVVTWDRRLRDAALSFGLAVSPAAQTP